MIETTELFWECECDNSYIQPRQMHECPFCGAKKDDCPDARVDDIVASAMSQVVDAISQDPSRMEFRVELHYGTMLIRIVPHTGALQLSYLDGTDMIGAGRRNATTIYGWNEFDDEEMSDLDCGLAMIENMAFEVRQFIRSVYLPIAKECTEYIEMLSQPADED